MDGITILNTYEAMASSEFNSEMFWFTFGLFFIVSFIGISIVAIRDRDARDLLLVLPCLVFTFFVSTIVAIVSPICTYETRYEVYISEDVPLSEVVEKYEIIGKRGEIYILRDIVEEKGEE